MRTVFKGGKKGVLVFVGVRTHARTHARACVGVYGYGHVLVPRYAIRVEEIPGVRVTAAAATVAHAARQCCLHRQLWIAGLV